MTGTRSWSAGGTTGSTAAAYLARVGRSVLVLERSERLGGACTLEQPFPDPRYLISPCAYVVGLLDQVVVSELELSGTDTGDPRRPSLWCPFADGSSFALYLDPSARSPICGETGFRERDVRGLLA